MQTHFSLQQLTDPNIAEANSILRTCVHCGFCTATCPTYVTLGDELDSPRGRIYLIKQMLEADAPASEQVVKHVDRCLSCLACMTTCPSGVHYMHLVDYAREHIEQTYKRPLADRGLRSLLAWLLPKPGLFGLSVRFAGLAKPFAAMVPGNLGQRLQAMLAMAPRKLAAADGMDQPASHAAEGERRWRVALLTGCAQRVLSPEINAATIRLLTRAGAEVVIAPETGCCGALTHHMGKSEAALDSARRNVAAWHALIADGGLDAVIINASGCGTTVKDYGFMLRHDAAWKDRAETISELTMDISEFMQKAKLPVPVSAPNLRVAYHAACSLQHGQKVTDAPKDLLRAAGYDVAEPLESHLCCGSAGTYNLLQPDLAKKLQTRKVGNLEATKADVIATGNIGCQMQIAAATGIPVVHTVALLDWATGGPKPAALA